MGGPGLWGPADACDECRKRFEEILMRTPAGRRRLQGRDVRHGLAAPEVEVEAGPDGDEDVGEVVEDHGDLGEPDEAAAALLGRVGWI